MNATAGVGELGRQSKDSAPYADVMTREAKSRMKQPGNEKRSIAGMESMSRWLEAKPRITAWHD